MRWAEWFGMTGEPRCWRLNANCEQDFLGLSYDFRPGKSGRKALDAVAVGASARRLNFVLDADIIKFSCTIEHECLVQFIEYRVAGARVVRLGRRPQCVRAGAPCLRGRLAGGLVAGTQGHLLRQGVHCLFRGFPAALDGVFDKLAAVAGRDEGLLVKHADVMFNVCHSHGRPGIGK